MKKIALALAIVFGFGFLAAQVATASPRDSARTSRSTEARDNSKAYILTGNASDALANLCGQLSQGATAGGDKDLLALCKKCDGDGENCKWVPCNGQAFAGDKDLLSLCKKCDDNGENCKWVSCGDQ